MSTERSINIDLSLLFYTPVQKYNSVGEIVFSCYDGYEFKTWREAKNHQIDLLLSRELERIKQEMKTGTLSHFPKILTFEEYIKQIDKETLAKFLIHPFKKGFFKRKKFYRTTDNLQYNSFDVAVAHQINLLGKYDFIDRYKEYWEE